MSSVLQFTCQPMWLMERLDVVLYSVLDNIVWYYLMFPSELYDNKLSMRKLYLYLSSDRKAGLGPKDLPEGWSVYL